MTPVNYSTPDVFRHHSVYFMKVLNPSHSITRETGNTLKILSMIFIWFGLGLGLGFLFSLLV